MKDPLKEYARLRDALLSEKATIVARLDAINAVLETGAPPAFTATKVPSSSLDKIASDYLETKLAAYYSPRKGTLPAKILKTLEKRGPAMPVKVIAAAVKDRAVLVNQACIMLLKKGRLKRQGRGQ